MSSPYGSANKNPRGDTPLLGRFQEAYASNPSFVTYQSPNYYFPEKKTFIRENHALSFGNQSRCTRMYSWKFAGEVPSK